MSGTFLSQKMGHEDVCNLQRDARSAKAAHVGLVVRLRCGDRRHGLLPAEPLRTGLRCAMQPFCTHPNPLWGGGYVCPARVRHPHQCPGRPSQRFTPKHHPLLQPRPPQRPAVSGAHVRAEWLRHPCLLRGPQHGDKRRTRDGTTGEHRGALADAGGKVTDGAWRWHTSPGVVCITRVLTLFGCRRSGGASLGGQYRTVGHKKD